MSRNTVSFDENTKRLDVSMKSFLSQHDVVYLTPAEEGYEGFPLGNGALGTMVWTPPDRIHFQINKCDTWDDAPPGSFGAWDPEKEGEFTSLRSCGELRIVPGLPVFDWMYLEDLEGRLSLGRAEASWLAKGPLGEVECRVFVAKEPEVLVVDYQDHLSEPVTRKVQLARWGTRVFEHWYRWIRRESLLGPEGTKAGCEGDEVWIEQPTRSLRFAVACKLVGAKAASKVWHSRSAGFELEAGKSCAFTLFLTVVTSEEAEDPLAAARDTIRRAAEEDVEAIFKKHLRYWSNFWSKSFVDLSDDYLENLWYINVYQVGSSCRGRYPSHFIGSLWSWNRDVRPWNHYYHWNQQQYTWPLHASGHPELFLPYAKWRLEGLPQAIRDAKEVHHCRGAFYADVANRRGYQDTIGDNLRHNLTPGTQIAMDMWRHYQYTLDEGFLKTYAYPIMRECVRFYLFYLQREDDGRYHVPKSYAYESFLLCKDTTSDLACIRQLFPSFVRASEKLGVDEDLRERTRQVLENLADYVRTEVPEGVETEGNVLPGTPIIAAGIYLRTGKPGHFWSVSPKGQRAGSHVANCQLTPIFPAGLIGLDQKETEEFEIFKNTLRCFSPIGVHGHNVAPVCLARMGLSEKLESVLRKWVDLYQLFPQGLFCYFRRDYEELKESYGSPYSASEHLHLNLANRVSVLGSSSTEYVDLPRRPFAHMSLEPGSILEATINEMLLQSYNCKIRVFPSMPKGWEGRFTLQAVGGFVVTSEFSAEEVKYIAIESKFGEPCHVANPWEEAEPIRVKDLSAGREILSGCTSREIYFTTETGHTYLIESRPLSSFKHQKITGNLNQGPKRLGRAILGKPRQF